MILESEPKSKEKPSVIIIANNKKGRYLKESLLDLIVHEHDVVVGLNRTVWYRDPKNGTKGALDYPIHLWFVRHTSGYYIGFTTRNKPMYPSILSKIGEVGGKVVFIHKKSGLVNNGSQFDLAAIDVVANSGHDKCNLVSS